MKLEIAIEKVRSLCRLRHLSIETERSYCAWLRRFSHFIIEQSPAGSPEEKMERFLTQLARQDVSASTQNQAFCALLFFYREVQGVELGKVDSLRAKKPAHLRFAPEVDEVRQMLAAVKDLGGYYHAEPCSVPSPLEALA